MLRCGRVLGWSQLFATAEAAIVQLLFPIRNSPGALINASTRTSDDDPPRRTGPLYRPVERLVNRRTRMHSATIPTCRSRLNCSGGCVSRRQQQRESGNQEPRKIVAVIYLERWTERNRTQSNLETDNNVDACGELIAFARIVKRVRFV